MDRGGKGPTYVCSEYASRFLTNQHNLSPVDSSDHNSILVFLKLPSCHHVFNRPSKTIWNYKKVNVSLAKELLKGLPLAIEPEDVDGFGLLLFCQS